MIREGQLICSLRGRTRVLYPYLFDSKVHVSSSPPHCFLQREHLHYDHLEKVGYFILDKFIQQVILAHTINHYTMSHTLSKIRPCPHEV